MPTWTTVPLWVAGQKLKAITLNLAVTAIGELQTWANAVDAMPSPLAQSFTGQTWATTTAQNYSMTNVPTGVPVMGFAMCTLRLGAPYCVVQIFDGATQKGADMNVVIPTGATGIVASLTVPFSATFTNTPVIRFTLGAATSTTLDNFAITGLRFK